MVGGGAWVYKGEPFLPKHNRCKSWNSASSVYSQYIDIHWLLSCALVYFGCKKLILNHHHVEYDTTGINLSWRYSEAYTAGGCHCFRLKYVLISD